MMLRKVFALFLTVTVLLPLPAATTHAAPPNDTTSATDEWEQTDPTGWYVYTGQTIQQVVDLYTANNLRIIDLKVERVDPQAGLIVTVTMVVNSGLYAKGWWWYVDLSLQGVLDKASQNNARAIVVQGYDSGGGTIKYAAVYVSNTGANAKGWWVWDSSDISFIVTKYTTDNARIIYLSSYLAASTRHYVVVMISNTGADAKAWWWYVGKSVSEISSLLNTNNARLIDIEPYDDGGTIKYNVVMEGCSCPYWWWYVNVPIDQILSLAGQTGARIFKIDTYNVGGQKRFAFLLINNSNAITTRVGELLRAGTDGATGMYLKQVGGPVLAGL